MSNASNAGEYRQKRPRVVEIIGLAGAGKTTLFKALGGYPEKIRLSTYPKVRKAADAPFFIQYGLQVVPNLFRLYRGNSRFLNRREFAWMSILKGWPSVLQQDGKKSSQVIVLDQGPVYLLAEMRESGPAYLKSERAKEFWQEIYCRWSATLDLIVWLDAEDINLYERIQTRAKGHVVKHEPAPTVFEFLARYRSSYEYVVSTLGTCTNGPRILRFDTSRQRAGEIVDHLFAEFGFS